MCSCCRDTAELIDFQEGRYGSFEYGRYGNPTTRVCEEKLAALEGAETALLSSSGMNSATTMLLALVPAGECQFGKRSHLASWPSEAKARQPVRRAASEFAPSVFWLRMLKCSLSATSHQGALLQAARVGLPYTTSVCACRKCRCSSSACCLPCRWAHRDDH